MPDETKNNIKNWAEDDRPREKLLTKGKNALSDAELLAIILGSGSKNETAVDLAKRILKQAENDWHNLAKFSVSDLCKFRGVGPAKAISVVTCLEIAKRKSKLNAKVKPQINSSESLFQVINPYLQDLNTEEFWVVYVNQGNYVIAVEQISKGGISSTVVDVRIVLKKALEYSSTSIFLAHNHPSGNLKPSQSDIQLTKKITEAAKLMDVNVVDHLIIGHQKYFSFCDEGLL